ncbi:MAG: AMP-binding protein [bacterium]
MNLGRLIEERAKEYSNQVAIIYQGKEITYRELNRNANILANGLKQLGIKKEDRVAMMLPNIPEFVYFFFACQKIGAVTVPFNTMYKRGEIIHILRDSGARAILCLSNFVPLINEIRPEVPQLEYIISTGERTLTFADPESTGFLQIILPKDTFSGLDDAYRKIGETLTETCLHLGAKDVWYKDRGSIYSETRKMGGFIFYEIEDIYILNAIIFLGKFNPDPFLQAIWVPPEVKDKVIEPLTSIEESTGKKPDMDEFLNAVRKSFEDKFGVKLNQGNLERDELYAYEKHRALVSKVR